MDNKGISAELLIAAIQKRASSDADFRASLIRDPHSTLNAIGIQVSECSKINIITSKPGELDLIISGTTSDSEEEDVEIDSSDLSAVAGGALISSSASFSLKLNGTKITTTANSLDALKIPETIATGWS